MHNNDILKRLFDIVFSAVAIIVLLPVLLLISVWINIDSKGPVFYRGARVGKHGRHFRIYKYRTMIVDADKKGPSSTSDDDPRITKSGRFLRNYKLDELPQFINILLGDMSFVGPRPQVPWAVQTFTEDEKAILDVRPGITDYASLKFHNEGEILKGSADPDKDYMEKIHPEKMKLAMKYVRERSMSTDIKIIFMTLSTLIKTRK